MGRNGKRGNRGQRSGLINGREDGDGKGREGRLRVSKEVKNGKEEGREMKKRGSRKG